ncbi:MAG: S1-like domain-containing RNA-binding protein [Rikenellaceae bacterium]
MPKTAFVRVRKKENMLKSGEIQKLIVSRFTDNGAYLIDTEENEVLLPNRYVAENQQIGNEVEVFLYHDSEDRLVASTDMPFIIIGEVALLECVDISAFGAFLDWGLPKDLFIPISNQAVNMEVGRWYLVYAYRDNLTDRIVASAKLGKFIRNDEISVKVGQEVEIVIGHESDLGYRVIIDNKHWGMIYHNQIFREVKVGEITTAYITRITEDNRIDVSLTRIGFGQVEDAAARLTELLEAAGGVLELGDKSSPEQVYTQTQMSKKMFKRGVGNLLKEGKIEISDFSIKLVKK